MGQIAKIHLYFNTVPPQVFNLASMNPSWHCFCSNCTVSVVELGRMFLCDFLVKRVFIDACNIGLLQGQYRLYRYQLSALQSIICVLCSVHYSIHDKEATNQYSTWCSRDNMYCFQKEGFRRGYLNATNVLNRMEKTLSWPELCSF